MLLETGKHEACEADDESQITTELLYYFIDGKSDCASVRPGLTLVKLHREGLVNLTFSDFKFWERIKVWERRSLHHTFIHFVSHDSLRAAYRLQELIIIESFTTEWILYLVDAVIQVSCQGFR